MTAGAGSGLPAGELSQIPAPVLVISGGSSSPEVQRSVAGQAAAVPGAKLLTLDGYDHNLPSAAIAPVLADFFTATR